jgi:hypothetical protein
MLAVVLLRFLIADNNGPRVGPWGAHFPLRFPDRRCRFPAIDANRAVVKQLLMTEKVTQEKI